MSWGRAGLRPSAAVRAARHPAWTLLLGLIALVAAGLTRPHPSAAEAPTEQQVKTSFIVRFMQFVEWPPAAFATPAEPITIAILGEDPLAAELEQVAAKERVNGRALVVRRGRSLEDVRGAQVLLVGRSEAARLPAILQSVRGTSVLTIGDFEGFAGHGGIIGFFMENDRVRFEINAEEAGRAGLTVHSRLLNLALIVTTEGGS